VIGRGAARYATRTESGGPSHPWLEATRNRVSPLRGAQFLNPRHRPGTGTRQPQSRRRRTGIVAQANGLGFMEGNDHSTLKGLCKKGRMRKAFSLESPAPLGSRGVAPGYDAEAPSARRTRAHHRSRTGDRLVADSTSKGYRQRSPRQRISPPVGASRTGSGWPYLEPVGPRARFGPTGRQPPRGGKGLTAEPDAG